MKNRQTRKNRVQHLFNAENVQSISEAQLLQKVPSSLLLYGTYESSRKRKAETESYNRSKRIKQEVEKASKVSDDEYFEQCFDEEENLLDYTATIKLKHQRQQIAIRRRMQEDAKQIVWKPWQQQVIDIISREPDSRAIHVVLDPQGGAGKSYLSRNYGVLHKDKILEMAAGRKADMLYVASQKIGYDTIFIDLCRGDFEEQLSYAAIEALKNGSYISTKYESKQVYGGPVHVVIFTNRPLDYTKLSADRWRILFIKRDQTVKHFVPSEIPMDNIPMDTPMDIKRGIETMYSLVE